MNLWINPNGTRLKNKCLIYRTTTCGWGYAVSIANTYHFTYPLKANKFGMSISRLCYSDILDIMAMLQLRL